MEGVFFEYFEGLLVEFEIRNIHGQPCLDVRIYASVKWKHKKSPKISGFGASYRDRTYDLLITSQLLYQLS